MQTENRSKRAGRLSVARPRTLLLLGIYIVVMALTAATQQGDTIYYADSIAARFHGRDIVFWDFGHLLWRPLGYVLLRIGSLFTTWSTDAALALAATKLLISLNWLSGAIALLAFSSWASRFELSDRAVVAAGTALILTHGFLNYVHTGSAYIPGLALLAIGLRELATDDRVPAWAAGTRAGVAFALSVLFWAPFGLALPAALASPLILRGDSKHRRTLVLTACLVCGAVGAAGALSMAAAAGVRSLAEFRNWMGASTHDIHGIGGFARAILGFGRSLVDVERLGLLTKRYMVHDPYNPVALADIARGGLIRLAVVYGMLALLLLKAMWHRPGRRALMLLAATGIPVLGFALAWQGGDLERYIALFPALFLVIGAAIDSIRPARGAWVAIGLVSIFALFDVPRLSRVAVARVCGEAARRVSSVPVDSGRQALLVTPYQLDEVSTFSANCPLEDQTVTKSRRVVGLVMANRGDGTRWRERFVAAADSTWLVGGRVWIANRSFAPRPPSSSKWAEGEDPQLHWADFPPYFSRLDLGPRVGGDDGFVEVLPTAANRIRLVSPR